LLRGALEEPRVLVCDEVSRLETVSGPRALAVTIATLPRRPLQELR
jgi:hypothetical protein